MIKNLKEEDQEFYRSWESIHKKGFLYYFRTKIVSFGVMMLLIYLIDFFLSKYTNYIMFAIIYIGITIIVPILSWRINESRYRRSRR
jgi:FtsH-binding integral membrane protein